MTAARAEKMELRSETTYSPNVETSWASVFSVYFLHVLYILVGAGHAGNSAALAAIIFMGMMELGNQLVDPWGDDDVDFPLEDWLDELIENSEVLLDYN